MIGHALLLPIILAGNASVDEPDFAQQVKAYTTFTTAHCASEIVEPYHTFNRRRDAGFVRSLKNTSLEQDYRTAVAEQQARDEATVYECSGPPPPPSPPGVPTSPVASPRAAFLARNQERLRTAARELPGYFDRGDELFAKMVAARDRVLGAH